MVDNKGGTDRKFILSNEAREILNLYIKDRLTPAKIAKIRKTSRQAVYKIISKLKKKGIINLANSEWVGGVDKTEPYTHQDTKRLHNQHLVVTPLYRTKKYKQNIGKIVTLEKNTVKISNNSIEIYSNTYFYGKTAHEAMARSLEYWLLFITKLENKYKTPLLKQGRNNIMMVNAHVADIKNPLAKRCLREGTKVRIRSTEDGKGWLYIDNSHNLFELETIHPKTSIQDMSNIIEPFFSDLRDNKVPLPSEAYAMILGITEGLRHTEQSLRTINKRLDEL